jgi:Tat protein secretion system quality control protein TatD with DNase activity
MGGRFFKTNNKRIRMKLSLILHGKTYSVESEDQFDGQEVSELVEQFKGLLVNAGYHPESVDQYFNTEYQWFEENKNE